MDDTRSERVQLAWGLITAAASELPEEMTPLVEELSRDEALELAYTLANYGAALVHLLADEAGSESAAFLQKAGQRIAEESELQGKEQ